MFVAELLALGERRPFLFIVVALNLLGLVAPAFFYPARC